MQRKPLYRMCRGFIVCVCTNVCMCTHKYIGICVRIHTYMWKDKYLLLISRLCYPFLLLCKKIVKLMLNFVDTLCLLSKPTIQNFESFWKPLQNYVCRNDSKNFMDNLFNEYNICTKFNFVSNFMHKKKKWRLDGDI